MKWLLCLLLMVIGYTATAQQEVELCPGIRNSFNYWSTASTSGGGWLWTLNSDTVSTNSSVRITWRDTGFYVIRVYYKDECGTPIRTYRVRVKKCPESAIFFPNAFTPNGDGLNDGWSPIPFRIVEMKWSVWNRYGEKVYETKEVEAKWDGKHKGRPQDMGNFVYMCFWRGVDGKTGYKKGNLLLIR
jgi:gliding motility-associated-like protein